MKTCQHALASLWVLWEPQITEKMYHLNFYLNISVLKSKIRKENKYEQQNKVVLDYNPKHNIGIHKSILI